MSFRLKELMVVALPQTGELAMDTCCAASCTACTEDICTAAKRTIVISPDDGYWQAQTKDEQFLQALREQLRSRRDPLVGAPT